MGGLRDYCAGVRALLCYLPVVDHTKPEASAGLDTKNPEMLKAQLIVRGLGGKDNITETEACMSRLRVVVKDYSLIDESILKRTGCNGIVKVSSNEIQIVYGTTVTLIKKTVDKVIENS